MKNVRMALPMNFAQKIPAMMAEEGRKLLSEYLLNSENAIFEQALELLSMGKHIEKSIKLQLKKEKVIYNNLNVKKDVQEETKINKLAEPIVTVRRRGRRPGPFKRAA